MYPLYYNNLNNLMYPKYLLNNKVLLLHNDNNDIIAILIYKIYKFVDYNILTIYELCVLNKYKSQGYIKILINSLLKKIKKKYANCYLTSIICNLRSMSNDYKNFKLEFPQNKLSHKKKIIIDNAKNIIKEWYMIELNEKYGIFYIPLYFSNDTYKVF